MDNRDYRVRAFLYIKNEGWAQGLYNHVLDTRDEAVDINPDAFNAEMRFVEIGDSYIVVFDLAFPPDKQGTANGLFNHTKTTAENHAKPLPNADEGEETGFVSIEKCGHRIRASCEPIERYNVE